MTEDKRFTDNGLEDIENQSFTDNLTGKTYWIDNGLDDIVDLLNIFNDKNEQLKQSCIQLKHRHSLLHDECLDAECDRDSYHKDVLSLEKENEQLKQRIKSRLHYYRELVNNFDGVNKFSYNIVRRIIEDLEDILK